MCKRQSNGDTIKCSWCGITVPKSVRRNDATVQSVIGLHGSNLKSGILHIGKLNSDLFYCVWKRGLTSGRMNGVWRWFVPGCQEYSGQSGRETARRVSYILRSWTIKMIKLWGISVMWYGEDENLRTWQLFEDVAYSKNSSEQDDLIWSLFFWDTAPRKRVISVAVLDGVVVPSSKPQWRMQNFFSASLYICAHFCTSRP